MMRSNLGGARCALLVTVLGILCGCAPRDGGDRGTRNNDGRSPLPGVGDAGQMMLQTATFNFVTADEQGNPLVRGTFTLPWPVAEGQTVRGSWESRYVGAVSATRPGEELNAVGPQVGRGTLTAEREGNELRINLNPRMNDNNVTLYATIAQDDALAGRWDYATFRGLTAQGVFEARREQ
jgi:hypothetical protein